MLASHAAPDAAAVERPEIRRAARGDDASLALIGAATFLETYAHMIPGPDMVAHCASRHAPSLYAEWLADPACALWIAETAVGAPAAYLVLTPPTVPPGDTDPRDLEIMRIYVLQRYQGTGLGHRLMQHAAAHARQAGARRLVLGMHKDNARALAFYESEGFAVAGERIFTVGTKICHDHVLARLL